MKLRRVNGHGGGQAKSAWKQALNPHIDRRRFLTAAGLGLGAVTLGPTLVKQAKAQGAATPPKTTLVKTICGNCSVGCGFLGEVENGVWVAQEPWFEHPINQGTRP
jgi:formate dehydrogenase major subunit